MVSLIPWRRREEGELVERSEHPLFRLREDFENLWDRFLTDWSSMAAMPMFGDQFGMGRGLEVDDQENELVVRAEAPGFSPEDLDVQVTPNNHLLIRAEHKEEKKEKGRESFRYGKIQRTVPLPQGVEADKIEAKYRNGVLEVHVPKGEQAKGKRIPIQAQ